MSHDVTLTSHITYTVETCASCGTPCCNRSFVNLARHMAGQHHDYAEAGK